MIEFVDLAGNPDTVLLEVAQTTDAEDEAEVVLPDAFELLQNYPNPFNPATSIVFRTPIACELRLEVYNALGQHIRTIFSGKIAAGEKEFEWDSRDDAGNAVGSGVYLYRVQADSYSATKKMLLIK